MADLKLTADRKPIEVRSSLTISEPDKVKFDDPRLTKALLKASFEHQPLSPADKQALEKVFGAGKADQVKDFLSIKVDNFEDGIKVIPGLLDLEPLNNVEANQVNDKMANSVDEVLQLETRLQTLLGAKKYTNSGIKEQIDQIKTALKVALGLKAEGKNPEDVFSSETEYRLGDRARLKPENKGNEALRGVSDEAVALGFMAVGAVKDPMTNELFETPNSIEPFVITKIPKTEDAKAWLTYLSQAQDDGFLATDQRIPRALLRKLRNLEEEPDINVFKDLTKYLNIKTNDRIAANYQTLFNNSVKALKAKAVKEGFDASEYNSDKELAANLEAVKMTKKTDSTDKLLINKLLSEDNPVVLGSAYRLLSDTSIDIDKPLKKQVVQEALEVLNKLAGFEAAYNGKATDDEKKVFLKQMLARIAIDGTDPITRPGNIDPTKQDPLKLYRDFTRTMEYLHAEINDPARSEANRNNLKQEFERFFSSGEVGDLLKEFQGKVGTTIVEKPELATALNLFRYDQRNLGLIKSLFNKPDPETGSPTFNIIDLIHDKGNRDFTDIAHSIEIAVIKASKDGNASQIPLELMDSSVSIKTTYAFNGSAFNPDTEPNPNKDIKERIDLNRFPLFNKLGLDEFLTAGKIKLVKNSDGVYQMKMLNKEGKPEPLPENFRTLLDTTLMPVEAGTETSDKELLESALSGVLTKSADDTYTFNDKSKTLMMLIVGTGASRRNDLIIQYDAYDPNTKVSFGKLLEQRNKLIALSNDKGLSIFQPTPVIQPYYTSEYKASLVSLAVNLPHLQAHYDTNIRPYKKELNSKGERIQIPHNVKSPLFGIDPSKAENVDTSTSALASPTPDQLYADIARIRASTREIFASFLDEDDYYKRPSLFDFDEPSTKKDYSFGYRSQSRYLS